MFSKTTKGQLMALTAILKMKTKQSSGESVSAIGIRIYGIEAQLNDVVLIVVLFMFSGITQTASLARGAFKTRNCSCRHLDR